MNDYLEGLEAGDKIVRLSRGKALSIQTIKRTTKTQVIIDLMNMVSEPYEVRIHKKNGRPVGASSFDSTYYRPATPKIEQEIEERQFNSFFNELMQKQNLLNRMSREDKKKIIDIVKNYE